MAQLIPPHGGTLIDRIVKKDNTKDLVKVPLDARELADLELIAIGALSPLTGFMNSKDYQGVLNQMRLANGLVWPLPITLSLTDELKKQCKIGSQVALIDGAGRPWGTLKVEEIFERDPDEAKKSYGTTDLKHPGVEYIASKPKWLIGGEVEVLPLPNDLPFAEHRKTPKELRQLIEDKKWRTVTGFQTRNPIHRAHEHLTKLALEFTDGLVIHPLVGETKSDDVPASVRFKAYEVLLQNYYPKNKTILSAFPAAMRYGGPKEAIFHALVRKNYGMTHLIVGRDHAGVGKFYGSFEAQEMFSKFKPEEIGVTPLKFDITFYCQKCENIASPRTCPHDEKAQLKLSGTEVRAILNRGGHLPREFTRPEVEKVLREHYSPGMKTTTSTGNGFVLWFTGLSGAGKSTLANAFVEKMKNDLKQNIEILDGDEVRTYLSKGLGFSKQDRDDNIRRIGFVARLLARNNVIAITAAISPYAEIRNEVRELAKKENVPFVEVFVKAELDALVKRDVKGLYKKALAGEIKNFTGVSDPYEPPANPEVTVRSDLEKIDESLNKIISYLKEQSLLK